MFMFIHVRATHPILYVCVCVCVCLGQAYTCESVCVSVCV